jgi:hypothetical protein
VAINARPTLRLGLKGTTMIRNGLLLACAWLAGLLGPIRPAEAQIVVTGARATVARPAPTRVAPDRGVNIRSPRRERNPFYAARPVYPPTPLGARASINFEPYTSKYYPTENENYPPLRTLTSIRSR